MDDLLSDVPPYLTVAQIAKILRVHRDTAREWLAKSGLLIRLPGHTHWKVAVKDVREKWPEVVDDILLGKYE